MKRQLNITIEDELVNIAKQYAKRNYTSISQLIRNYFLQLKRELEAEGELRYRTAAKEEQLDSSKTSSTKT